MGDKSPRSTERKKQQALAEKKQKASDDACDRMLHNAHRITLKGPSQRKEDAQLDA